MGFFHSSRSSTAPLPLPLAGGFTLVELIVVAGIIGILSVVVISTQSQFNRSLLLSNTASDIALTLRNAQIYGIGSKTTGNSGKAGYGVFLSGAAPTKMIFFADTSPSPGANLCHPLPAAGAAAPNALPGDCYYTVGSDALVQTFTLNNGMYISNVCAFHNAGNTSCTTGVGSIDSVAVIFTRPNTTAMFGVIKDGTPFHDNDPTYFTSACIQVSDQSGSRKKAIVVTQVGQIAFMPDPNDCS